MRFRACMEFARLPPGVLLCALSPFSLFAQATLPGEFENLNNTRYTAKQHTVMKLTREGTVEVVEAWLTVHMAWKVIPQDSDGRAGLEVTIEKVSTLKLKGERFGVIGFDSEQEGLAARKFLKTHPTLAVSSGTVFTTRMSSSGEVRDLKPKGQKGTRNEDLLFIEDMLRTLLPFVLPLSEKPLVKGEATEFDEKEIVSLPRFRVFVKGTSTYKGEDSRGLHRLERTAKVNVNQIEPLPGSGAGGREVGEWSGGIDFDSNGRIVSCKLDQRIKWDFLAKDEQTGHQVAPEIEITAKFSLDAVATP